MRPALRAKGPCDPRAVGMTLWPPPLTEATSPLLPPCRSSDACLGRDSGLLTTAAQPLWLRVLGCHLLAV